MASPLLRSYRRLAEHTLVLLFLSICVVPVYRILVKADDGAALIGWQGDSFNPRSVFGANEDGGGPVQISKEPLAFVWKNFMSAEEAKHIVMLAAPRLRRSLVGDGHKQDKVRTSYGMFIPRFQDEIVGRISQRLADWTGLPLNFQEDMQVLQYSPGQTYKPDMDANSRMCTLLVYLSDTEDGGETAFPSTTTADWLDPSLQPENLSAECASGHVAVKPEVGTALLFYSMPPGAEANETLRVVDPKSLHTGCPPAAGHLKWTSTIWTHVEPFRPEGFSMEYKKPMADPAVCQDTDTHCEGWAKNGECDKNPDYMIGKSGSLGHCRQACGLCTACAEGDTACMAANREAGGYIGDLTTELRQLFPFTSDEELARMLTAQGGGNAEGGKAGG